MATTLLAASVAAGMLVSALVMVPIGVAAGGLARLTPGLLAAGLGVALLSSVSVPAAPRISATVPRTATTASAIVTIWPPGT